MNFIRNTNPIHQAEDVLIDSKILINFFIDISASTLTDQNIVLFNVTEGKQEPVEYEYKNRILTLKAKNNFKPNMHYQVQLIGGKNGLANIVEEKMAQTYILEFYTQESKKLQPPLLLSPTDLVEIRSNITFKWRPAIDAKAYKLEVSKDHAFQNIVWPLEKTIIYEQEIIPDIEYEVGGYYVRMKSIGHNDEESHFSTPIRFYYNNKSQGENEPPEEIVPEEKYIIRTKGRLAPNSELETLQNHFSNKINDEDKSKELIIIGSSPQNKELNIQGSNREVIVSFDEDIDEESVTRENFYIVKERN